MNGKVAIGTALGLILGLMAGLGFGGLDGGKRASAPAPAPVIGDNSDTRDQTPLKSRTEEERGPAPAPSLAELINQIDTPPLPTGDGVITGTVAATAGAPLEGAVITATPNYPESRNQSGLTIEQRVQENIRYEKWRESARRSATSAPDGTFRIEGLAPDTDYAVWAELEGWRFERTPYRSYFRPGMEVTFTGTAIVSVPIEVRLPDGSPAKSAIAEFHKKGEPYATTSTQIRNGRGELKLEPGVWIGSATGGDDYKYKSEAVEFTVQPGQTHGGLEIRLLGRPGIEGAIGIPDGYKFWALRVLVLPATGNEPGFVLTAEEAESQVREAYINDQEDWKYRMLDVPPGTYRAVLVYDHRVLDWRSVTIVDDVVVCNLAVPPARAQDYIPVRVFDPDGNGTDAVTISLGVQAERSRYRGEADVFRPAPSDDLMWVRRIDPREVFEEETPAWSYEITVWSESYGSLTKPYARNDTHELHFRFVAPAFVELTVPGFDEHELRDKLRWSVVGVGDGGKASEGRGDNPQDVPESLRFGPFTPGEYDLVLMLAMRVSGRELVRRTLTLTGGENFVQGEVPRLGTLTVRCRSESEANGIGLYRGRSRYAIWNDEVKREGVTAWYYSLPDGEYTLESSAGVMRVEVSGDTVVDFLPRAYDCMVISAIRPGGQVEATGLRNGDKLIEVDGNPCTDMKTFNAHIELSLGRESTTWTVLRDGLRTEVTFSGLALTEILKNKRENREDIDLDRGYRD